MSNLEPLPTLKKIVEIVPSAVMFTFPKDLSSIFYQRAKKFFRADS